MDVAVIISACVLGCSVLTFVFARSADKGKNEYWQGQVTDKLENISDDLKEIKAWQHATDERITKVSELASHANERAEAAHNRLDRAGLC